METSSERSEKTFIRLYSPSDVEQCLSIFGTNCPAYFTPDERSKFMAWLGRHDRFPFYVLENHEEILACGGIYLDDRYKAAGLSWGMVMANHHRQGYGSRLTRFRMQELERVYPEVPHFLETSQHTAPFYEKMGFSITEVEPDGFGPGLDKVVMYRNKGAG